jgi:predicted acylesterase/phospholipase RssA
MSKKKKAVKKNNTAKEQKPKDDNVVQAELLPNNPLVPNPIRPITDVEEANQRIDLIEETQSLIQLNETKLKAEQRKANLEIALKKVEASKKMTDVIDAAIESGMSDAVIKRVAKAAKRPLDFKLFTEAIRNLSETRDRTMEDAIHAEFGSRKRVKVKAAFRIQTNNQDVAMSFELPDRD